MNSKYETPQHIKQEFIDFLDWYREQDRHGSAEPRLSHSERMFRLYAQEKDIAFHGDLRKLHGANTRNATKELLLAVAAMLGGVALAIGLIVLVF